MTTQCTLDPDQLFQVIDQSAPLSPLQQKLFAARETIEAWFDKAWQQTYPPITSSVDLRNAGYKLAPIDTNLFPAGFNNLHQDSYPRASELFKACLQDKYASVTKILIIPENHTRNEFYNTNLAYLRDIISRAGFEVRIGSLSDDISESMTLPVKDDLQPILLEPMRRREGTLFLDDFVPEFILLNNDLSAGIPDLLLKVTQPIRPLSSLGWAKRLKSHHFMHYKNIVDEFSQQVDCDPWLLAPLFLNCGTVNFMKREGENCIFHNAEILFEKIKQKYAEYNIKQDPYIIIKADSGTYGMGVMAIKDPNEIYELNRKGRTNMAKSKSGQSISQVILQEGVYTTETMPGMSSGAEPVVYMFGPHVIGSFYRMHEKKGADQVLNTPGMTFKSMAPLAADGPPHFYAYSVVARLAAMAAAYELAEAENVS